MTHQPLTAAWRVIATSRSASSPWSWRLSDAEMEAFHAANTAGDIDTQVLTYSDGERVMRARDKQAAAAARLAAYRGEQAHSRADVGAVCQRSSAVVTKPLPDATTHW